MVLLGTQPKRILVALPCLNEAASLHKVLESCREATKNLGACELLVIDDGSSDSSAEIATQAGATVIQHGAPRGVGACFQTSLRYAIDRGVDVLVTIDSDGQFDPFDIPKLISPIFEEHIDFVTGSRFCAGQEKPEYMSHLKLWGNHRISGLVSSLTGQRYHDVSCGFRAYSKEAILSLNLHGQFTYTHETFLDLSYKNLRIKEVPISVKYFKGRQSRVAKSIFRYAMLSQAILFRSYRDYQPLKFFWIISGCIFVPSLVLGVFFFAHFLITDHFRPFLWTGVTSGFLATVSLIFFILGILADSQGRLRVNQERELYLLKKLMQNQSR